MKTFKLNIPKESRNWSNALDAKMVLCCRSWVAFNNEEVKEVYIFQEDGTLIVSHNGKVAKTRWEYIAQNTSLIIENIDSDTYMLKPTYYDNKVLALQVDGTSEYVIMINENCIEELMLDSYEKVVQYFGGNQESSFALNKSNQENLAGIKEKGDLTPHEMRIRSIKGKQKRRNINIGVCLTGVTFLIYSVLYNEIFSIYAFGVFSFLFIISLVALIFWESNSNKEYNTFLKIEKKHPLQWFHQ
jgi:hypothetical protein